MARRVFLHLGSPKSGTTYLQDILWRNRDALRAQGVLLPGQRRDHFWSTLVVRESPTLPNRLPEAPGAWDRLLEETRAWDGTVILTHEFFGGATAEQAGRAVEALAPAEVHLVFTVRDYVRVIPGAWQEKVKLGSTATLSRFVHEGAEGGTHSELGWRTVDAGEVLDRWGRHVPPERVHVVTVPPSGSPPELLWQRFADLCGIEPGSCDTGAASANAALGAVELELLRRVNGHLDGPVTRNPGEITRWLRGFLAQGLLAAHDGPGVGLSPEEDTLLRERTTRASERLAAAGYDVVGDLDEFRPPSGSRKEVLRPDDLSDAEVLDAALRTCAEMLGEYRAESLRADRERRRADRAEKQLADLRRRHGAGPGAAPRTPAAGGRAREGLVRLSERHPSVMRARVAYRRVADAVRGRRSPRDGHPTDPTEASRQ